jgi:oxygen-independent coproporphyrinogen-3 oxidase
VSAGGLQDRARERIRSFGVAALREAGLFPLDGGYFPAIYYPPITMYPEAGPDEIFRGLAFDADARTSLYFHIPFCPQRCAYCHWVVSVGSPPEERDRYLDALRREVRLYRERLGNPAIAPTSILVGGGTPSMLSPAQTERFLRGVAEDFDLRDCRQITCETEPTTILGAEGRAKLRAMKAGGVNRVSLGVQSFRGEELRRLGRIHDGTQAQEAAGAVRHAGFDNLSLDLMMWLPEQSVGQWLESVDTAIDLEPEHLSLYMLELYPNAPLGSDMAREGWSQAADDVAAEMYEEGMARLEAVGWVQYEISNLARPGRESRHNLKYWTDGEWIGFGPGAHSTHRGDRWRNVSSTDTYIARVGAGESPEAERRTLSAEERWQEAVITGMRLSAGVSVQTLRDRYGVDLEARFGRELDTFRDAGLLAPDAGRLTLTRRGMLLANEVLRVFI